MPTEQVIVCESACVVTLRHEVSIPLLNLTPAEGGAIAVAMCLCFAVGFVIRSYRQALLPTTGESDPHG